MIRMTRREVVKLGLAAGTAELLAPCLTSRPSLSTIVDLVGPPVDGATKVPTFDRTILESILAHDAPLNSFEARADAWYSYDDAGGQSLIAPPQAFFNTRDSLNLPVAYSQTVQLKEAQHCRSNFEQREEELKDTHKYFFGVDRSPIDSDIAVLGTANYGYYGWSDVVTASQYRDYRSVVLFSSDLPILWVSYVLLRKNYRGRSEEFAQSLTPIGRWLVTSDRGQRGVQYETPSNTVYYDPQPAYAQGQYTGQPAYPKGRVFVLPKEKGKHLDRGKWAGLYF
jgi:hypothetical protein